MANRTIRVSVAHDVIISRCVNCGIEYGVTVDFDEDRRKDKRSFFCPNGHSMSYGENEEDRLRRERDRLKQDNARLEDMRIQAYRALEAEAAQRKKAQAEMKRVQRRAAAGVCPCCNRSFVALSRHMKTKHPDVPFMPAVAQMDPRRKVRGG